MNSETHPDMLSQRVSLVTENTSPSEPDAGDVEALTQEHRRSLGCHCLSLDGVWHHERHCRVPAAERIIAEVRRETAERIAQAIEVAADGKNMTTRVHHACAARIAREEASRG